MLYLCVALQIHRTTHVLRATPAIIYELYNNHDFLEHGCSNEAVVYSLSYSSASLSGNIQLFIAIRFIKLIGQFICHIVYCRDNEMYVFARDIQTNIGETLTPVM